MEQNENQDSIRERIRAYAFDLKLPLVRRDIDNLDPNASYRVTISYDSSRYYLYGLMKVEGIG